MIRGPTSLSKNGTFSLSSLPFFANSCKIAYMHTYNQLESLCAIFDQGFDDIQGFIHDWGTSNIPVRNTMEAIITSGGQRDTIITDVELNIGYLYMLSEFFQDPKAIGQVLTQHKAELTPEGDHVLSFWQENPGFWCYFSVKEELEDDFYLIEDHMTGEEHILYSKGVGVLLEEAGSQFLHFVCLMLSNGGCLQTIGLIKYNHLPVTDFKYYCSLFKPQVGLKDIISKHYRQFWKLDDIAHMPRIKHKVYDLGYAWQPFSLPSFDIAKLGGKWITWKHDSLEKSFISQTDPSMDSLPNRRLFEIAAPAMSGSIVRDPKTGEMGLATNAEVAYPFYAAMLNRAYPELKLPEKPSVFISAALRSLARDSDLPFPWKKFDKILEYREEPEWDDSIDYTKGTWKKVGGKPTDTISDEFPFNPSKKR